jgi:hypothetical protein
VTLTVSPHGDALALSGDALTLISARTGRRRIVKTLGPNAQILGWPAGQSGPLVAVPRAGEDAWRVWQLEPR